MRFDIIKYQVIRKLHSRILYSIEIHCIAKSICDEMRKDADKLLSNQSWIADAPVDSGLIYCYNENKIKIRNNQTFECDMKSCSQYKVFRVFPHILGASKKKDIFQKFISKLNCRGNSEAVSNTANSGEKMTQEKRKQNQHKDVEESEINQLE